MKLRSPSIRASCTRVLATTSRHGADKLSRNRDGLTSFWRANYDPEVVIGAPKAGGGSFARRYPADSEQRPPNHGGRLVRFVLGRPPHARSPRLMLTAEFDYELPESAIAQVPAEPRDGSRLLRTEDRSDHRFRDLPNLLMPGDLLVLNDTKVRAARLVGRKAGSGGTVELLLLKRLTEDRWQAMVRPARRLGPGVEIDCNDLQAVIEDRPVDGIATVLLKSAGDPEEAIARTGTVPLPPYINVPLSEPERYQTVFASRVGSAAAPTAGLHFTAALFDDLRVRGIETATVDLEVGLDTFRPIATHSVEEHRIHAERFRVSEATAQSINAAKADGRRVVAVGTTTVRVLETTGAGGRVDPREGASDLFIVPGHHFAIVDVLITNFHAPRSSLLCLVAAMLGPSWRKIYETALERGYRFLSFGDAMLIES